MNRSIRKVVEAALARSERVPGAADRDRQSEAAAVEDLELRPPAPQYGQSARVRFVTVGRQEPRPMDLSVGDLDELAELE